MADNRKYYYLKLKEDFFDSEEIRILESQKDGYIYSNILLKMYLRSLRNEGRLMYRNIIPYTPEILATLTGHQVGVVEKALQVFEKLGLIEVLDNGAIYVMDIQNYIGQSSTEADRQRAYYNRVKAEKSLIEGESPELPELPESEQKEPGSNKAIKNYTTDFEEFWAIYPRKIMHGSRMVSGMSSYWKRQRIMRISAGGIGQRKNTSSTPRHFWERQRRSLIFWQNTLHSRIRSRQMMKTHSERSDAGWYCRTISRMCRWKAATMLIRKTG